MTRSSRRTCGRQQEPRGPLPPEYEWMIFRYARSIGFCIERVEVCEGFFNVIFGRKGGLDAVCGRARRARCSHRRSD